MVSPILTIPDPAAPLETAGLGRVHRGGRGVREVSLTVRAGEVVAMVGPNGSGKTTLAGVLATLWPPSAGRVRWFGREDRRSAAVRRRLGVVTDQPEHFGDLTGRQNAHFFARRYGVPAADCAERVGAALDRLELARAADRPVREYSLGMRRRLALAEVLAQGADLLVLDEPTLGLDHAGELLLAALLRELAGAGKAAVIATNDVHLAQRCATRIAFLHDGLIVREGAPAELLAEVRDTAEIELAVRAAVDTAAIAALPEVLGVAAEAGVVRVLVGREVNPALVLAALDGTASLVTGMTVRRPDLGDLFLKLTGRSLAGEGAEP